MAPLWTRPYDVWHRKGTSRGDLGRGKDVLLVVCAVFSPFLSLRRGPPQDVLLVACCLLLLQTSDHAS